MSEFVIQDNFAFLPEEFTFRNAQAIFNRLSQHFKRNRPAEFTLDFQYVRKIDSAAVSALHRLQSRAAEWNVTLHLENRDESIRRVELLFQSKESAFAAAKPVPGFFERLGQKGLDFFYELFDGLLLISNIFYWAFIAFFRKKLRRKGEVIRQSLLIGFNALPIVSLIAFLIGFILALQSAVQLRQFGANIYVADLVAVAMVSEMGPLITAIIIAGRSGSAFAAEIATMKITEEFDALQVMGINPLPYLVIPKLYAILITLPLLTVLANVIGILGGLFIGITYLDLDILPFIKEVISVLRYKEVFTFVVKSVTFAVIILVAGAHFGLKAKEGAEDVGKMTTASVVAAIILVIIADSIIGLLFYFGEPVF